MREKTSAGGGTRTNIYITQSDVIGGNVANNCAGVCFSRCACERRRIGNGAWFAFATCRENYTLLQGAGLLFVGFLFLFFSSSFTADRSLVICSDQQQAARLKQSHLFELSFNSTSQTTERTLNFTLAGVRRRRAPVVKWMKRSKGNLPPTAFRVSESSDVGVDTQNEQKFPISRSKWSGKCFGWLQGSIHWFSEHVAMKRAITEWLVGRSGSWSQSSSLSLGLSSDVERALSRKPGRLIISFLYFVFVLSLSISQSYQRACVCVI